MRRSHVNLVLATAIPFALAGCSKEDTVTVTDKQSYPTVQACVDGKIPVDVCSEAYMTALAAHRAIAPTYSSKTDCEADFVPDYCQVDSSGRYLPKMGGFELEMSADVSKTQYEQAKAQAASGGSNGGGGFSGGSFVTGMLLGNMLSGIGNNRYNSQPVYQYRDSRGAYQSSTLSRQIDDGRKFENSSQALSSVGGSYSKSTLGRSLDASSARSGRSSASSSVSRGGFGSQATARSGWGGSSSYGG
jgi:uncharacterized protein YgiB involved in biofilm formation